MHSPWWMIRSHNLPDDHLNDYEDNTVKVATRHDPLNGEESEWVYADPAAVDHWRGDVWQPHP